MFPRFTNPSRRIAERCVNEAFRGRSIKIEHNDIEMSIGDSDSQVIRKVRVRTGKRKTVEVYVSFQGREGKKKKYKVFWSENGKDKEEFVYI